MKQNGSQFADMYPGDPKGDLFRFRYYEPKRSQRLSAYWSHESSIETASSIAEDILTTGSCVEGPNADVG